MPVIFLREKTTDLKTLDPIREVVDGQQRIRTLLSFISPQFLDDFIENRDQFTVRKSHNPEIANRKFSELNQDERQKILDYQFSVHIFPSTTDDREILQIFARMNSTGVKLKDQELRNAEHTGELKNLMYLLASEQLGRWRSWEVFSEQDIARMDEVELTSEVAFMMFNGVSGRTKKSLDNFYRDYEEDFPQASEIAKRFRFIMDSVDERLGQYLPETAYSRKTYIYPLLAAFYALHYNNKPLGQTVKPKKIPSKRVNWILEVGKAVRREEIPDLVELSKHSTTHVATRRELVSYLCNK